MRKHMSSKLQLTAKAVLQKGAKQLKALTQLEIKPGHLRSLKNGFKLKQIACGKANEHGI